MSEETASNVPLDTLSRQAEEIKSVLSEIQNEETTDNTVQKDYVDIQESHTETTPTSIEVSDIRQETDVHSDYQPYTPTTTESITVDEPTNTIICVAMPAWSVPGIHAVLRPFMQ